MIKARVKETDSGITGEFTTKMYDIMMRDMRNKGWLETDILIKEGIANGLALEIGPGPGYLGLEWLKKTENTKLKGLDISEDMLNIARNNAQEYGLSPRTEYFSGDAGKLPFDDEHFDAAFTNGSLHEWANPREIMNEIFRVLKPEGKYVITDLRRDMPSLLKWLLYIMVKPGEMRPGFLTSVNAAYTTGELKTLLDSTKLSGGHISQNLLGITISGQKPA
jgi:ubiquinone/menaquinone biosynthesis C-methylase UbiE